MLAVKKKKKDNGYDSKLQATMITQKNPLIT